MALSMVKIIDCQMTYQQEDDLNLSGQMSFLACTGAYNIGTRGFYDYTMGEVREGSKRRKERIRRSKRQSLKTWVSNLEKSSSRQKWETKQHIISVKRCAEKGRNWPMCGTQKNYCSDNELKLIDSPCEKKSALLCSSLI